MQKERVVHLRVLSDIVVSSNNNSSNRHVVVVIDSAGACLDGQLLEGLPRVRLL